MAKFLALSPWHNGASAGKNPINITTYTESDSALIMSIGLLWFPEPSTGVTTIAAATESKDKPDSMQAYIGYLRLSFPVNTTHRIA